MQTAEVKPGKKGKGGRNHRPGQSGHWESGTNTTGFPHLPFGRCDWTRGWWEHHPFHYGWEQWSGKMSLPRLRDKAEHLLTRVSFSVFQEGSIKPSVSSASHLWHQPPSADIFALGWRGLSFTSLGRGEGAWVLQAMGLGNSWISKTSFLKYSLVLFPTQLLPSL